MMQGVWRALVPCTSEVNHTCRPLQVLLGYGAAQRDFNLQRSSSSRCASTSTVIHALEKDASSEGFAQQELHNGLPEVTPEVEDGNTYRSITEDEMRQRKNKAVKIWLEHQVGKEKLDVVQILQAHHVIVRGGPEEGTKLINALIEWKQRGVEG
ncbi:hypothetical protein WJX75_000523 [Coccomyxa subellipsoidea]|uniref:Uncharacterized protein n=1 Tax=Coccomyxa subellipsoidea TaxID=248742 RepID=A0ABR2YBU3_9CHLO